MPFDAWLTLVVILGALALLATDRLPPAAIVLGATITLLVTDVIDAAAAFSGFANPAPITVAALYVLAAAAQKTGLLAPLTARLLGSGQGRGAMVRLLGPTAGASAFFNNTPLVAMLIPDVVGWADRQRVSASRYLLPLSYAAILGGTVTLIGTSTNLVVSGLLEQSGQPPLGLFEITLIGGPVAIAGLAVLLAVHGVVPERRTAMEQATSEVREFAVQMRVVPGGPADGTTVADAGLRDLAGVYLVQLERAGRVFAPVPPNEVLAGGDRLMFAGDVGQVVDLQRMRGLESAEQEHLLAVESPQHTFYEAVVGRASPLAGRTLKEMDFRSRHGAAVVAIHRDGHRVGEKLGQVRLRVGDTLLLLADPGFGQRWRSGHDFLLAARLGGPPPSATRKAPLVGAVAVTMILLAAFNVLPILQGALVAAGVLIATRTLSVAEARDAVDLDVVVLIGAAFGLGAAIETTGLAQQIAEGFVAGLSPLGTIGIVLGLVLATSVLTEMVTNNAAAVVVYPIAISIAAGAGLDPRLLAMAVAVAASTSFLSPIGYQTNTMVYGPGGYRFADYLRAGIPLNLTVLATITTVVTLAS
jgi:di/tricarboxylate transporter